jgi:hypothetical protein
LGLVAGAVDAGAGGAGCGWGAGAWTVILRIGPTALWLMYLGS